MIISFSVENFMSFKEEVHFSMIANGRERQHIERVPQLKNYDKKVLPVSVLYGGNASGKSNFVKALGFAKNYIISGATKDQNIAVKPFRLCSESIQNPSKFTFQLLIDENIYEYGFEVTSKEVQSEWLEKIDKKNKSKILFERNYSTFTPFTGLEKSNEEAAQYMKFLAKGTLPNKLFLSNVNDKQMDEYEELSILQSIYEWFAEIIIIMPMTRHRFDNSDLFDNSKMNFLGYMLNQLDTGVKSFDLKEIPIPPNIIELLEGSLDVNKLNKLLELDIDLTSIDGKNADELIAINKTTQHLDENGNPVEFDLDEESDGTKRLIDVLPAFYFLCNKDNPSIFIIDEFNKSLHPLLTRKLLDAYLSCCNENTRSQLIFTTHDVMLLDQDIFRRDEIWFTERNNQGVSKLSSLSDFKGLRYDKKLRNSYLMGRFDGIPDIVLSGNISLSSSLKAEHKKGAD